MATFNYPILMAADIIGYDVDLVPVGKDQKQHLEFTRDIAANFNKTYAVDFFTIPEPYISKEWELIPWTDGRKMSKSYDNFIGVFDDEKLLKKKIMSIVTWSEGLDDPKDPDSCNVFALMKFFADETTLQEVRKLYEAGWYGYGHAKLKLLEILLEYFKLARDKYAMYMENYDLVEAELNRWNQRALELHSNKYKKMKEIVWL